LFACQFLFIFLRRHCIRDERRQHDERYVDKFVAPTHDHEH
jgi:hypothetical protein